MSESCGEWNLFCHTVSFFPGRPPFLLLINFLVLCGRYISMPLIYIQTHSDFVQVLIDARAEDSSSKMTLTDGEIIGACYDFLIAGYETTGTLLSFTSYLLAVNPDKQELLCEAIDTYNQENEATLYDASQNIPYLDWVIQESLRIYPPVPM